MMDQEHNIFQKPGIVVALALLCCALWGSAFPGIKVGYQWFHIEDTGSQILFAGIRFFLAGTFTFIIASVFEGRLITMKRSSVPYVFGQGLLQTTAQYVLFYIGLAHTSAAKGSILNASNAFFTIICAHFLVKNEKITVRKLLGCLVGFAGVIVINLSSGGMESSFLWNGEGFIILCAFAYGASSVTIKMISHRESPATITAYQLLSGSSILIILGLISGGQVTGFTVRSTALLIYLALLTTISFTIWATLVKYNPVGKVAIYSFSIPVFGVFLSAVILGEEIFTGKNLLALILVSIGILIVNFNADSFKKQS